MRAGHGGSTDHPSIEDLRQLPRLARDGSRALPFPRRSGAVRAGREATPTGTGTAPGTGRCEHAWPIWHV
jgi:hypothetical protein